MVGIREGRMLGGGRSTGARLGRSMVWGLCALASGEQALAQPTLLCDVRQADVTRRVTAQPTSDPYGVVSHDIDERFRFKAVVGAGPTGDAAYVKLYIYDMAVRGAPVLLHMATHLPPWPLMHELPALTGWNHVYSSVLGRELVYGCTWQGDAP